MKARIKMNSKTHVKMKMKRRRDDQINEEATRAIRAMNTKTKMRTKIETRKENDHRHEYEDVKEIFHYR